MYLFIYFIIIILLLLNLAPVLLLLQVNEDRETLARWKEERTTYLKLSIQHYLQCLTLTHDSDLHVFRWVLGVQVGIGCSGRDWVF